MSGILVPKPMLGRQLPAGRVRGLVGYWLFNEGSGNKVFDLSGNGLNLDFYNSPVWSAGKFGSSVLFVRGSSQYLEKDIPAITGYPFTITCWFNTIETANFQELVWVGDKDVDVEYFAMRISGTGIKPLQITARTDGASQNTNTSNGISENKWHFGVYIAYSATNRVVILDADFSNKGTGTTSITPSGLDRTSIGRLGRLSPLYYMDGQIDLPMIYNRALSASEIAELYLRPFAMFDREPLPLWTAATQGIIAPPGIVVLRRRIEAA